MRNGLRSRMILASVVLASLPGFVGAADVAPVELVVVVHQGDQPVEGLAATDFEVRQQGRKATVIEARRVTDRQWMLFFDLASPGSEWIAEARTAAVDLVREGFSATDRVGVAVQGADGKLLVVRPTQDRDDVLSALASVADERERSLTPNADVVAATVERADPAGLGEGYERGLALSGQARVSALAQSVQGLAGMLHAFGGNNHIVVFSSGIDLSVAMGNDLTRTLDHERAVAQAESAAGGDVTLNNGPGFAMGSGVVEQIFVDATAEVARRGCAVHGVEFASSPAEAPRWAKQGPDGLWFLAEQTGGEVWRNPENLASDFAGLLQRTSVAYRLSVRPAKLKQGGGFHPAKVKVVDSKYEIETAKGFYVPASGR